jgi:YfiR/HmsC-like
MRYQKHIAATSALILTVCGVLLVTPLAHAMDQVSIDNIQAAVRTLSFLESLPKEGPIVVGVVYPSDISDAQAVAETTAQVIAGLHGPNSRALRPLVISTNDLATFDGHVDVLFLIVGASRHSALILDIIRRHRLVTISDDPLCASAACCVLSVRTGQRVEISLNAALAEAVGARFSLVFTMVVKRQ